MSISKRLHPGQWVLNGLLIAATFVTLYPFWHVLMYSLSDPQRAMGGGLFLLPKGFALDSYAMMFQNSGIFQAYSNSLFRLFVGTFINVILTAMLAYPLSIRRFLWRTPLTLMIFFTMLFSGGMIPTYLLVNSLGLVDSLWALIVPSAISAWNFFIMKNYFQTLPPELEESASMDGATPVRTLFFIILPVSLPVIAAISLFYGVFHWNAYFDAVIYIHTQSKEVLPVFLRSMLNFSAMESSRGFEDSATMANISEESVKMATIVASMLPMLLIYPFLQKYYVKGVLIGSVKG
ncbi:putative aldouronate transport system permease protein [Paenibacillus sp. UNCCL117]|uniref:carbohydrate ABC transporter permease n=1 Tax=unclassified Paenibacillus TaxID=185978 RepID=UPI00088AC9DD|nr:MULTISPECIES: carbohydrate ABC transporter permease [unclassified Paenibacillus]SDD57389.1 putative aldouronate transport system permease protein [Paenibacillus sp. cl123]SFW51190.1 putative aldouronate transport system permease protein [Paenibacillus sp. UNCCL117]